VVGVRNQADNDIDLGDLSIEGFRVVDVKLVKSVFLLEGSCFREPYADGLRVGNALGQSLRLLESPAGNDDLDARLAKDLSSWAGNEASAEQQNRP
jgi:hypothetical protein